MTIQTTTRNGTGYALSGSELAPEPQEHPLRSLVTSLAGPEPEEAPVADGREVPGEKELVLPGFEQPLVLCIASIVHRGQSLLGHVSDLTSDPRFFAGRYADASLLAFDPQRRRKGRTAGRGLL